jgi:hypothetical protein
MMKDLAQIFYPSSASHLRPHLKSSQVKRHHLDPKVGRQSQFWPLRPLLRRRSKNTHAIPDDIAATGDTISAFRDTNDSKMISVSGAGLHGGTLQPPGGGGVAREASMWETCLYIVTTCVPTYCYENYPKLPNYSPLGTTRGCIVACAPAYELAPCSLKDGAVTFLSRQISGAAAQVLSPRRRSSWRFPKPSFDWTITICTGN